MGNHIHHSSFYFVSNPINWNFWFSPATSYLFNAFSIQIWIPENFNGSWSAPVFATAAGGPINILGTIITVVVPDFKEVHFLVNMWKTRNLQEGSLQQWKEDRGKGHLHCQTFFFLSNQERARFPCQGQLTGRDHISIHPSEEHKWFLTWLSGGFLPYKLILLTEKAKTNWELSQYVVMCSQCWMLTRQNKMSTYFSRRPARWKTTCLVC